MTTEEYYIGYGALLRAAGIDHFRAREFAEPGREASDGTALQVPPVGLWERSLDVWRVLEWLRTRLGDLPIRVTSGYRDEAYNRAVGGSSESQHIRGVARDIVVRGLSPSAIVDQLERHPSADTLGIGRYPTFTHIDTRGHKARWSGS